MDDDLTEARRAGRAGEVEVVMALLAAGAPVLHGLILPFDGRTVTEIDVVAMVGGCLLCLEVKAHGGAILVSENGAWTRVSRDRPPVRFMDPRQQNRIHLDALRKNTSCRCVRGAVIFTGQVRFDPGQPAGVHRLSELSGLLSVIRSEHPPSEAVRSAFLDLAGFHWGSDRALLEAAHHRTLARRRGKRRDLHS